ncbi:type I restriction endonuclease [Paramuribaculum intestinale]|uniref:Type I restriction endonuclease n=2 Tax=Paramuribaculum intestinale TaxID=2094151 RepID=A0A2V1IVA3_9BACT|nr:restriction endonuclease subunit S [Paramuribaculum intestinale]PWB06634.1 type I restriction endonuclease [Paramuribaculum intestinale]WLT40988.1 restriction endonuclease subunit S [Paramuribaculum intestinale]
MSCIHLLYCDKSHYQNFTPPFDIPESWQWVRLGDYVINRDGERVPIASTIRSKQSNKIYDYYGAAGAIDKVDNYIFDERLLLIGEDGANLLSRTKDNAFFADGKYWVNNHAHVLDSSDKFLLEFVALYINTIPLDDYITGSAQPKLSQDNLNNIHLPIPPIEEQRRILTMIESLMSIICEIRESKQQLSQSIALTKSKILDLAMQGKLVPQDPADEPATEMLRRVNPKAKIITDNPHYPQLPDNWVLTRIKDVFEINPKNKASDNIQAGFVPMASIHDGYSNKFRYDVKQWGEIKSGFTHFADGDIAVAKISPCLENRKSMILRDLPNGIGAGTTELLIFRSTILIPEFSLLFFKSDNFIKCCTGTFNGVVGQQRVGKSIVEDIHIPIPPLNTQRAIIERVQGWFNCLDNIIVSLLK